MADGENDGLWGDITNENLEILGRAISGVTTVSLSGTTQTLTVTQGALSEGHFMVLELGGSPSGTNTITINPNTVARLYMVRNLSGQDAVFTQGSGGNVTVPNGKNAIIYCNGAGSTAKVTDITADFMRGDNNLSDLDSAATALTNLGLTATAAELNKVDGFTGTATDLNYAKDLRATGVTTSEFDRLDGLTASTAELNKLDGATVTTAEINKLDGFTGTATDLNYAKDLRATGVTDVEFNKLDGLTASTAELNKLDGATLSTSELNILDGATLTTAELNHVDGVTSNIQTQLNSKISAVTAGTGLTGGGTSGSVTLNGVTLGTSTWEAGTSTTESLVSPAKVKAAVETLALTVGVDQTWQDVTSSRVAGTAYENTTDKPIMVSIQSIRGHIDVSSNGSSWVELFFMTGDRNIPRGAQFIVPVNHYYRLRVDSSPILQNWVELR